MADFPQVEPPTRRTFSPGNYPVYEYQSLSGVKWKRILGNRPYGMTLELYFENINDGTAARVLTHYDGEAGTFRRFRIHPNLVAGMADSLKDHVYLDSGLMWAYAEPPSVESVFPGVSSLTVKLVGELDYGP